MKEYYTYAYLREDRTPYYVGKGTGSRAFRKHERRGKNIVPLPPKDRILILKKFEDEDEAFKHEDYMIELYGRECDGGILINLTIGGRSRAFYKTDEERKTSCRQSSLKYYYEKVDKDVIKLYRRKQREDAEYRQRERYLEKERRKNNPEKEAERGRKYYEKNKELIKQKRRERYHKTKDNQIAGETQ